MIVATATLALLMTAGGNLMYFYLIGRVGPTKTQSVSFLVPVFALLAGVLVLDEPFTISMALGLGVIIVSVLLVLEIHVYPRTWTVSSMNTSTRFVAAFVSSVRHGTARAQPAPVVAITPAHVSYAMLTTGVLRDRHSELATRVGRTCAATCMGIRPQLAV